ncbi:DUF4124 domain-containing protein [Dyella flava]|uniref:DUF4124 domain-containing protein n=1 Tax=Dyella flava TaxID=1920170 RepID=A0ABS2K5U6_9GAMM|nr:DUF4124 domain-containing protein [Dyella flava]MBM7126070.1 DUF4124 domain-containing protein [Dyella flava]GLQ49125.1 hypothetical protein GCM10010872_05740 [Dyella flava]
MHRLGAPALLLVALLFAGLHLPLPARADTTTVYKCSSPQGQVIYQGTPCTRNQQQQTMQLENGEPVSSPLPASPGSTTSIAAKAPAPPALPSTPPSLMYRCINAVNGNSYFSSNGNPQPYYAPLAVTGIIPTPLGQTYAPPGRGAPTAATIASHYVLVHDSCQAMTAEDTCSELRNEYDENERKLSRAFKSDQPPLLQRESDLIAQLNHC